MRRTHTLACIREIALIHLIYRVRAFVQPVRRVLPRVWFNLARVYSAVTRAEAEQQRVKRDKLFWFGTKIPTVPVTSICLRDRSDYSALSQTL